jgi:bifunctional DNase/RNase
VEKSYVATVEVEGSLGAESIDARSSDALNLAALEAPPMMVGLGM